MGRNRFVSAQGERYDISDGDWVEIKKYLSYGDSLRVQTAGITGFDADALMGGTPDNSAPEARLDMKKWVIERLSVWLLDWSFVDAEDRRVELTREAIENLDPETAQEIHNVLDTHLKKLEEEKKLMPTKLEAKTSAK